MLFWFTGLNWVFGEIVHDDTKSCARYGAGFGRVLALIATVPPDAVNPLVAEIGGLAEMWAGKFGYGLSDELGDMAEQWKVRANK